MDEEQEQQLNRGVIAGISRLADPLYREERHKMFVYRYGLYNNEVDRRSVQHLVGFLDAQPRARDDDDDDANNNDDDDEPVVITELELQNVRILSEPSDGGLDVLRDFFSRSDTSLTKVTMDRCDFGSAQETSRLLAAFHSNRTVTDLTIKRLGNLSDAPLGYSLADLMQNMPQLQRLECSSCPLRVEGVRALQPGLLSNRTLKELNLWNNDIRDEGVRLIADALVENNTTIDILDISDNFITSAGLPHITRMLESTRLKTISFWFNQGIFSVEHITQHFVTTLQHTMSTVQELPHFNTIDSLQATYISTIINCLARNRQLNHVNLLLVPLTLQHHHHQPPNNNDATATTTTRTTMWIKTCHKAIIAKFATVPNNAGASAIFKLFTARPQLLEKRIKRPAVAAAAATILSQKKQKRQRL
jgi:Leucine Rich repeat